MEEKFSVSLSTLGKIQAFEDHQERVYFAFCSQFFISAFVEDDVRFLSFTIESYGVLTIKIIDQCEITESKIIE